MSAPEGFRQPLAVTAKAITAAARKVEVIRMRRRALLRRISELNAELHEASRVLRSIVADATSSFAEPEPIDRETAEELIDRAQEGR